MEARRVIDWTPEKLSRFKKAFEPVRETPQTVFEFEGDAYVSGYAKYLISYLETKFKPTQRKEGKT